MDPIVLNNTTSAGESLQATFLPDIGMNMISYKKGNIEVIDQSTKNLFEERYAGLGALIGPHFHHRSPSRIPPIKDESLFPFIARIKAKGIQEPFSHGIARYAPWQAQASDKKVTATISGKDVWKGIPLAELEGQNFKMNYTAELTPEGLEIEISVVSDTDSIVGIHYYYHLPQGKGTVISSVQNKYIEGKETKPIPNDWNYDSQKNLRVPLDRAYDCTFYPYPNPLEGKILLDAVDYQLLTKYSCMSQENCWQLYHPKDASFVCMEPLSAQDPRHPNLTVSSLQIKLEILKGKNEHET
jgi:hypothetical protein